MFDRIASDYDRFNAWASLGLHQHWRRALFKHAPARSAYPRYCDRDGRCGFSGRPVRAYGCRAGFFRTDARQSAGKRPGSGPPSARQIRWMNGSADRLPFSDRSFECITSAFALRNLRGCLEAVFKENFRVLRAGGKVLHMDFGRPGFGLVAVWPSGPSELRDPAHRAVGLRRALAEGVSGEDHPGFL